MKERKPRKTPKGPRDLSHMQYATVAEVRDIVETEKFSKYGVICPCCDQLAGVYKRSITVSWIRFLVKMHKMFVADPKREWVKVASKKNGGELQTTGGDYAKLRFFGLIEPKSAIRDDGSNRSGYWRPTHALTLFLGMSLKIPQYVFLFNNQQVADPLGANNPKMDLIEFVRAAKEKFDYQEIMSW